MKKFELGNIYKDSNGKEYRVISRTDKTVVIEDVKKPGNSLYQERKAIKTYASGAEYLEMIKGSAPSYRSHKKGVGRYLVSNGKREVTIKA